MNSPVERLQITADVIIIKFHLVSLILKHSRLLVWLSLNSIRSDLVGAPHRGTVRVDPRVPRLEHAVLLLRLRRSARTNRTHLLFRMICENFVGKVAVAGVATHTRVFTLGPFG